jgi:hypothetical protein
MREERFLAMIGKGLVPFGILILLEVTGGPRPLAGQEAWARDLDLLLQKIEELHPNPWGRISRSEFTFQVAAIKEELANWDEDRATLEVMGLVASLRDGHTRVRVSNKAGFNAWYPLRIEAFADGLFVTATDEANRALLRGKVLRFGRVPADDAYHRVAAYIASDDSLGVRRVIPDFLSNAVVLQELGILEDRASLLLEVLLPDGTRATAVLTSEPWRVDFNWAYAKDAIPTLPPHRFR